MINTITDQIKYMQNDTKHIRNICVLAHVDHGKTSLVDSLISFNNIINPKLAGQMRFMDTRPDEQERCITMKSSAISIVYDSPKLKESFLINLIDSPGHVDFSSEIFSALKICDGALILIDVVEGVCSQTISVIKQAWDEKIKCILVFNKIDRLILSLKMDPMETYLHLCRLLESVNSLMGSLIMRDINIDLEQKTKNDIENNAKNNQDSVNLDDLIQEKENELYFSPEKGNVIFASAIDCWAFSINSFADILCQKLGFKKEALVKLLWGDFYLNAKTKQVSKQPISESSKPMFVDLVLNNLYKLYNIVIEERNSDTVQKACKNLNIILTKPDLSYLERDKDTRPLLKTIMRQWLSIPNNVFDCIVLKLPDPFKSNKQGKLDIIFPRYKSMIHINDFFKTLYNVFESELIESNDIPIIGFISKMVGFPRKFIGGEVIGPDEDSNDVKFMAFARIYTGNIKRGNEYYVIGPKHNPQENHYDIKKVKFDNLYIFMGQSLEPIEELYPGCIFSIGGLENYVIKTATISNCFDCPSIIPRNINKNSIIKVSIISNDIKDMPKLVEGLKKLNKSDPAVDYYVQENGEHILVTSGEVHLERCVKDLEDQLAKVKFKISESIVNFKEGLYNKTYSYKKNKLEKGKAGNEKKFEIVEKKERKQNLIKDEYELVDGDQNIDDRYFKIMDIQNKKKNKKVEKLKNKKFDDIKNMVERKDIFLEKNIQLINEKFSFAIDITPNRICEIVVSAVGMDYPAINYIENNESLIKEFISVNWNINEDLKQKYVKFQTNFLKFFEKDKKLRKMLEVNTFAFGPHNFGPNMLIVRDLPKKYSLLSIFPNSNTAVSQDANIKVIKEESKMDKNNEKTLKIQRNLEEETEKGLNGHINLKEFLNAIKSGFDLVIENGPLCDENCYGVIFILEDFKFINEKNLNKNEDKNEEKIEETKENKMDNEMNVIIDMNTVIKEDPDILKTDETLSTHSLKTTSISKVEEPKKIIKEISDDASNISGKQSKSSYGPFLGQLIGTMKSCCRQAFLNGQPRLYEALYLCLFQIKIENIGSIHSVINKRRGKIIDEKPNDEGNICTIEAHIPVAESFHFVEEIRKKSSGLANTMLQFDHWEMIEDDPFCLIKAADSEDYGTQNVTPNVAKKYIDKIRERKGLLIDKKLVIDANKQRNLSKKN